MKDIDSLFVNFSTIDIAIFLTVNRVVCFFFFVNIYS